MSEYGPQDSLFLTPDGDIYRYKFSTGGRSYTVNDDGSRTEGKYFVTHYFWHLSKNDIKMRDRGVFSLPYGTIRIWSPDEGQ